MDLQNLPAILTPDLGLLFWMLLAFLVIFFVLAKFGFPVITKMVEERKAYIDDSLKKAHEANEKLANIQQEGENLLKEARERQQQILSEAAQTRDAIVEQAQSKAREESSRIITEAKAQIEAEKSQGADRGREAECHCRHSQAGGRAQRPGGREGASQAALHGCRSDAVC